MDKLFSNYNLKLLLFQVKSAKQDECTLYTHSTTVQHKYF